MVLIGVKVMRAIHIDVPACSPSNMPYKVKRLTYRFTCIILYARVAESSLLSPHCNVIRLATY